MEKRKNIRTRQIVEETLQKRDISDLHIDIKAILVQTQKTNGRVGKLENWKSFMQGGMAILALMVVPIFIYIITHYK